MKPASLVLVILLGALLLNSPALAGGMGKGKGRASGWGQGSAVLVPAVYWLEPSHFKTPPGWGKGKKTGWRGQPLPPGQMKKFP